MASRSTEPKNVRMDSLHWVRGAAESDARRGTKSRLEAGTGVSCLTWRLPGQSTPPPTPRPGPRILGLAPGRGKRRSDGRGRLGRGALEGGPDHQVLADVF